ncbi:MAG: CHASE domain-containing protein [Burkholderiales bacterium]|nr:CHASE domain-containing protein [Burkholderiales bacterium]
MSRSPARPPTPLPTTPTTAVPPVPPTAAPTVSPTDARPRSRPARLLQPWLVLLAALGLTLTAAVLAQRAADAREQAMVLRAVEEDMRRLQARMDAYVALLRATRAFVDTQDERLSRETFAEFVARLRIQRDYPGIQGVGWTPRVDGQRVAGFEAGARAQGLDGFTVHPPGPREPMFSILYLEPLDARNRAALGYDMSTEPVRGRAMAEARDHAGPALTGRVTLKQEIDADKQAGFLMYVPVYAGGAAPATVAQRRAALVGYVYAPFRAADFFGGLFGGSPASAAVRVYAGSAADAGPQALLYQSAPVPHGGRELRRSLAVGKGGGFTLVFTARPDVLPFGERLMVPGIAIVGGAVSLLLFLLVRAQIELLQRQREQHARTAEQKALLDQLIDQSGEGIIMADAQGVVRVFNPAARAQHGVGASDGRPEDWSRDYGLQGLDGQPLALADTPLYRALQGQTVQDARWQVRRPDGSVCVLAGTATPLRGADGRVAGAVLISRDETGRLKAEQEREALLQEISRSNRELDQFAYVASHDLKAPLRGIGNLAQWIEEDLGSLGTGLPDGVADQLRLLRGRVGRMESLIDGILLYSRAGRTAATQEAVDVALLLRETVELLSPPAGVEVRIEPPLPRFTTDRVALQQVFMNLIGNAIKHAAPRPAQGQGARVEVSCQDDGRLWRFAVSDNGPGIAPAYHERIWGLFQTLEARDKVEGTGIGLSIVRKAVEAHGGRAWVESAEGQGATFFFTWPKSS